MALDQNLTPPAPETMRTPAIENEIPAYRAISPYAVLSLVCGVLAILSFANWFFLAFAALAVIFGIQADRRIKRDPEIWTGRGLGQAGIALALVFGLSAVTLSLVQDQLTKRAASRFAQQYADILKNRPIADAIYYQISPLAREGKTPAELYKEVKSQSDPIAMDSRFGPVENMKKRLSAGTGQDVHFETLEATGFDGITPVATALLELHGPASKDFPQKEQYALLVLRGVSDKGKLHWMIEEAKFPYEPASYVPAKKPVDDGHGHAH